MTTVQMKIFIETAKCLNFTEAAERLYMSQPSLSRHISSIEAELNVQLFIRANNRVYLTPGGEALYRGLENLYGDYNKLVEHVLQVSVNARGSVNLGLLEEEILPDAIKKALTLTAIHNPNTDVVLTSHSFKTLTDGLRNRSLDLIVTLVTDLADKKDIEYRVLETTRLCLMVQSRHPIASRDVIELHEFGTLLKDETFILMSPSDSPACANTLSGDFRRAGFVPKCRYAPTAALYALWVAAGQGMAIVSSRHANSTMPDITFIPINGMSPLEIVVAWLNPIRNPAVTLFLEQINDVL